MLWDNTSKEVESFLFSKKTLVIFEKVLSWINLLQLFVMNNGSQRSEIRSRAYWPLRTGAWNTASAITASIIVRKNYGNVLTGPTKSGDFCFILQPERNFIWNAESLCSIAFTCNSSVALLLSGRRSQFLFDSLCDSLKIRKYQQSYWSFYVDP